MQTFHGVELYSWNPKRLRAGRLSPYFERAGIGRRVNNFGDLLGPLIVKSVADRRGMTPAVSEASGSRLFSVGSVMHFTRSGDTIWGSGVNGKVGTGTAPLAALDVRAVRGPLTREVLIASGANCPAVYGDPGLLTAEYLPVPPGIAPGSAGVTVIPNLNDLPDYRRDPRVIDPRMPLADVIAKIAASSFVVASSLHGVIVAESLGIPARVIVSRAESWFKYEDYFLGSGRTNFEPAQDVAHALRLGPHEPPTWDPRPLIDAFPWDLWPDASATH